MTGCKWLIILSLFCYIFTACTSSTADMPEPKMTEIKTDDYEVSTSDAEKTEMLYRTKSGECYHRSGCMYLKSKIPVSPDEATNMGLRPCSRCNPGL